MRKLEQSKKLHAHSDLIKLLGGTKAVKQLMPFSVRTNEPIRDASISEWRKSGIPPTPLALIEAKRPEIYKRWQALQSENHTGASA
jgi:hypothetical protein